MGLSISASSPHTSGVCVSIDRPLDLLDYRLELHATSKRHAKPLWLEHLDLQKRIWVEGITLVHAGDGYATPGVFEGTKVLIVPKWNWTRFAPYVLYRFVPRSLAEMQELFRGQNLLYPRDLLSMILGYVALESGRMLETIYPFRPLLALLVMKPITYQIELSGYTDISDLQRYAKDLVLPFLVTQAFTDRWKLDSNERVHVVDCRLVPCRLDGTVARHSTTLINKHWLPFARVWFCTIEVAASTDTQAKPERKSYFPPGKWFVAVFVCVHVVTRHVKVVKCSYDVFSDKKPIWQS